jgi:hypothetical protein
MAAVNQKSAASQRRADAAKRKGKSAEQVKAGIKNSR